MAFDQVESEDFRVFLQYLNPVANDKLPNSHNTIKARVMTHFLEGKETVKQNLHAAVSDIHFTLDLWSSPNHLGLLGINAHFTREDRGLQIVTIALRELRGAHSGPNIAEIVLEVIDGYGIMNKVGYFTMDNATNNHTMMEELQSKIRDLNILFDAKKRRLRCLGHIINLSVTVFLYGASSNDVNYIQIDKDAPDLVLPSDAELDEWRKIGPLGKLHNIATFIGQTPQRRNSFKNLSGNLMIRRDNMTRWNSWHTMIDWVLTKLQPAIVAYTAAEPDLTADILNGDDWQILKHVRDFLGPFKTVTKTTEGRKATLELVLPGMDFLLLHYEENIAKHSGNRYMEACLDAGYTKLIRYFNPLERNPVYIAAVVLNPSVKWTLFSRWNREEREEAERSLQRLFEEDYSVATGLPERPATPRDEGDNVFLDFMRDIRAKVDENKSELERYCDEGLVALKSYKTPRESLSETTAIDWWCEPAQRMRYLCCREWPLIFSLSRRCPQNPNGSSLRPITPSATNETVYKLPRLKLLNVSSHGFEQDVTSRRPKPMKPF